MKARIYSPAKTAMQSGRSKQGRWHIDFIEDKKNYQEPIMGWAGARQTLSQLKLTFQSADEAASYLQQKGIPYTIDEQKETHLRGKSYSDNFDPNKIL